MPVGLAAVIDVIGNTKFWNDHNQLGLEISLVKCHAYNIWTHSTWSEYLWISVGGHRLGTLTAATYDHQGWYLCWIQGLLSKYSIQFFQSHAAHSCMLSSYIFIVSSIPSLASRDLPARPRYCQGTILRLSKIRGVHCTLCLVVLAALKRSWDF